MTTVTLDDLRKKFDDVVAVDGLDLEIEDGEFLVIVGPSGCGKSTTLRLIAGLERATGGRIFMSDQDVTDLEPYDRNIAMVFQNYALYPHMTAKRNITFGMTDAGDFTEEEIEQRVEEAAEILDISDLLDRKPKALSGGERQRVALGRVIVRDPDVFLMDEPLSNLDAKLRIQMRAELSKLHRQLGTTTIYVTHDQTEAMTLGHRVVVMNDGEIQQVDVPQQLYDFPANRFVATFIGDPAMNLFDVELQRSGNSLIATHSSFSIELDGASEIADYEGRPVQLGVRPEDLEVANGEPGSSFPATVTVTEPLGDSLLLECEVNSDTFKLEASPRKGIEPGSELQVTWDPDRLHLFDPDSGQTVYHSDTSVEQTVRANQELD